MNKRMAFLAFFACAVAMAVNAQAAWRWEDGDTVTLPDYGVRITRPDERWRVLEPTYPALIEMRLLRPGQNAVMSLKDVPGKNKKWRAAVSHDETQTLIQPYQSAGWQFYETSGTKDRIDAEATDASRRILQLRFHRKEAGTAGSGWFLVEAVFPREMYQEVSPAFRRVAASFVETSGGSNRNTLSK